MAAPPPPVCYVSGTLIRTLRGDVAVEHLAVGDLVVTSSGAHRPIRWLGHQTCVCRGMPLPRSSWPVRVAAHAFGDNKPSADLYLSPGHAVCVTVVGEVLVPVEALINGSTIAHVETGEISYWHVELDSHDILLANNLPAESYLDMGNRSFFRESAVVSLGGTPDARHVTHADFCRPFHSRGAVVAVVRAQLAARAHQLADDSTRVTVAIAGASAR